MLAHHLRAKTTFTGSEGKQHGLDKRFWGWVYTGKVPRDQTTQRGVDFGLRCAIDLPTKTEEGVDYSDEERATPELYHERNCHLKQWFELQTAKYKNSANWVKAGTPARENSI